mmetsp:Transcript_21736/g.32469  ORF Transcript_21736/g.32469 Transcript_21736/m.32469 type:complete len:111 (+) Transcript_21736:550-882(+)
MREARTLVGIFGYIRSHISARVTRNGEIMAITECSFVGPSAILVIKETGSLYSAMTIMYYLSTSLNGIANTESSLVLWSNDRRTRRGITRATAYRHTRALDCAPNNTSEA